METNEDFGQLLTKYLMRADRSPAWLAQRLDVSPSTVSRWESGQTRPSSLEMTVRVADLLSISEFKERKEFLAAAGYAYFADNVVEKEKGLERSGNEEIPAKKILPDLLNRALNIAPEWLADRIDDRFELFRLFVGTHDNLLTSNCGDTGIELGRQRLLLSNAFGSYFAGLLERDDIYVPLEEQIDSPVIGEQENLSPIERIYLALYHPRGPRTVVIASEGGMGKSTLAAKVVRCLFEQQAIDMILGDSAKLQHIDAVTGKMHELKPAYYDISSFYNKLQTQLGLPVNSSMAERQILREIGDRLAGRRGIIVIDNLETVEKGDHLLRSLKEITSRDMRAIVTTREVHNLRALSHRYMTVSLRPIVARENALKFLLWHIDHYKEEHPALRDYDLTLLSTNNVETLIARTGGIPLLIQLVFSEVARSSWAYLNALPSLFGDELLNFLYRARWHDLGDLGTSGKLAQNILLLVAAEQYQGKRITFRRLVEWSNKQNQAGYFQESLQLLYERFLIVNHDRSEGNFTVFPSLAEFLSRQGTTTA